MVYKPNTTPLETEEGKVFVAYLRVKGYKFTHIPGETGGTQEALRRAIRMKQQGTSKGFPDYLVLKDEHIIAIELKRQKGGVVSPEQQEWLKALADCGVACAICHGAQEAIEFVEIC